jgi:hypothetical protein
LAGNKAVAIECETTLDPDGFVFSVERDARAAPHPDVFTAKFRKLCDQAGVASDRSEQTTATPATEAAPVLTGNLIMRARSSLAWFVWTGSL